MRMLVGTAMMAVRAGASIPLMERQRVGAFGKFDAKRIVGPFPCVIFRQFGAQAACLHPDHGIHCRVKILGAPELFGGDLVFLQRCARMFQCVMGEIPQQLTKRLRTMQSMALGKLLYLPQQLLTF